MNTKEKFGILFIVTGFIVITLSQQSILGGVIGTSAIGGLGLWGLVILVIGIVVFIGSKRNLEEYVEHEEAHNAANYEKLKLRLKYMEHTKKKGHKEGQNVPTGRYLSENEEQQIGESIINYIPNELKEDVEEIYISGSLSRQNKGRTYLEKLKTHPDRLGNNEKETVNFTKEDNLSSDSFYLSDIDVGIVSEELYDYFDFNWNESISKKGRNKNRATVTISTDSLNNTPSEKLQITSKEIESAPNWVREMLTDLSKYKFAGEYRPINITVFKYLENSEKKGREVIYKN